MKLFKNNISSRTLKLTIEKNSADNNERHFLHVNNNDYRMCPVTGFSAYFPTFYSWTLREF